eukprot:gene1488-1877_t
MSNRERVLYWPETYVNIKELGRGVSGVVYKASNKSTGEIVAIKLVDMNHSRISSEQVQGEVRALLTLNPEKEKPHMNIIKLVQCFIHKTTAIFILEYVDGGTLEDFMYTFQQGLPLSLVSHLLYQMISAIDFMNAHKCSHRDIKPANILLLSNKKPKPENNNGTVASEDGYIGISNNSLPGGNGNAYVYNPDELPILKVTDYGYASITASEQEDMRSTLAGSPLYMAPEIIHIILSPNLEPRIGKIPTDSNYNSEGYNPLLVDIWAIGAVAFRLVTGIELINAIFPNLNQTTVLAALVNLARMMDSPVFQRGLDTIPQKIKECGIYDEDCISFISSLLKLDPKERPPLKDVLNHPFLKQGKESFEQTIKEYEKDGKGTDSIKIPSDISDLFSNKNHHRQQKSNADNEDQINGHNNNNSESTSTTTTTTTNSSTACVTSSSSSPSLISHGTSPSSPSTSNSKSNSTYNNTESNDISKTLVQNDIENNSSTTSTTTTSTTTTTTTTTTPNISNSTSDIPNVMNNNEQPTERKRSLSVIDKIGGIKTSLWSSSQPHNIQPLQRTQSFLSHQRKKINLFPTLLPTPLENSPPQDTMIWRSPPVTVQDTLAWSTIAQDAIFQVQFGYLTSVLRAFSASEEYVFRIITQTRSPVEIAVSNHKDSILYMYNIVKTVVAPQLISLSSSFNESSIYNALCAILQQLDYEQDHYAFVSGWKRLEFVL